MARRNTFFGWTVIIGAIGFAFIVVCLHLVQPDYDPLEQQISELALGRFGSFMLLSFSCFALSVFALQKGLQQCQAPVILRLLFIVSAICLFGAGLFRLNTATDVHIVLVSVAFVLIVIGMCWLPRSAVAFKAATHKIICWALAAATALCVALSEILVPLGLSQRGAALCILIWLAWIGRILTSKGSR